MMESVQFWPLFIGCLDIILLAAFVHFVGGDIRRTLKKHSG